MEHSLKRGFRKFQLQILGWVSLGIAPLTILITVFVYGLPFPKSISEGGTIANQVSPILPYCLGALSLFAFSYSIKHAYDRLDAVLTACMGSGFTVVAMQMCGSPYVDSGRVGLLGLSAFVSGITHNIGAVVGFGSMILWILLCFRKSNKPYREQTHEKHLRNALYTYLGIFMIASIFIFGMIAVGFPSNGNLPWVFIAETMMLTAGGIACLVKGELILKDKSWR